MLDMINNQFQNLRASSDNNFQSEPKPNATSFTDESSPLPSSILESKVTFPDPPHESDELKVMNDRELRHQTLTSAICPTASFVR